MSEVSGTIENSSVLPKSGSTDGRFDSFMATENKSKIISTEQLIVTYNYLLHFQTLQLPFHLPHDNKLVCF